MQDMQDFSEVYRPLQFLWYEYKVTLMNMVMFKLGTKIYTTLRLDDLSFFAGSYDASHRSFGFTDK